MIFLVAERGEKRVLKREECWDLTEPHWLDYILLIFWQVGKRLFIDVFGLLGL